MPSGGDGAVAGRASTGGDAAGTSDKPPQAGSTSTGGGGAASTAGNGGSSAATAGKGPDEGGAGGEAGGNSGPDECPDDPNKLSPGVCGCGIPETSNATLSNCQSLKDALLHRYDFEGTGMTVTDRVGTAHGSIVGASLSQQSSRGVVVLTGGTTGPYVDLPNRLVSTLTSVSVEAWITWKGGPVWQRIFDFGDSTATSPENNPLAGKTYLFATPNAETLVALASYSHEGNEDGQQLEATAIAPLSTTLSQVVVVANGAAHKLALYINGTKISEQGWTGALSKINDVNVWLGRSQYAQDPELNAVFHDFRIYGSALTDAQVATAFLGGTDPAFLVESAAAVAILPKLDD